MIQRRVCLLVLVCAGAWSSGVLRADEPVPLVPVQVRMLTDSDWTKIEWVGLDFIVLRHKVVYGHKAKGIAVQDFHVRKKRLDYTPLRVDFDTVLVGGFKEHHRCTIAKGKRNQTIVSMAFGYDHETPPFFTVTHIGKTATDPLHRRSYVFDVPVALQRGNPQVQLPPVTFASQNVAFYRPWNTRERVGRRLNHDPGADRRVPEAFLAGLSDTDLKADLARARAEGTDLLIADWAGPGTTSDRLIQRVLSRATKHGLKVVPNVTKRLKKPAEMQALLRQAAVQFGSHDAVVRLNSRHVLMFDGSVTQALWVKGWREMFESVRSVDPKPFTIATGFDPNLLDAGFDGIYAPLLHHTGVPMPRIYVASYVFARARQKLFLSSSVDVVAQCRKKMARQYERYVRSCPPMWVVRGRPAGTRKAEISRVSPARRSASAEGELNVVNTVRYSGTRSGQRVDRTKQAGSRSSCGGTCPIR